MLAVVHHPSGGPYLHREMADAVLKPSFSQVSQDRVE